MHETKLISEISCPTHTHLAQSVEHKGDDPEVVSSVPIEDNSLAEFHLG